MNKGALNSASGASIVLPSPTNIILGSHTRSPQRDEPRVLPLAGHGKHVSDRQVARPVLVATPAPACRTTPAGVRGRACVKSSTTNPARVPPSAVLVAHIADRLSTLCQADASAGAARLLRMCAASSGWRPGFIHMDASPASRTIGCRSCTSSRPPSAAAIAMVNPLAVFDSYSPCPTSAARYIGRHRPGECATVAGPFFTSPLVPVFCRNDRANE